MEKYLVLVENERTEGHRYDHWQDITGARYHYPIQYKNKISPGAKFIYYRGTRRASGLGRPEYFGTGTIGDVYLDPETDISLPKSKWHWYCDIIDYEPFQAPVYFKLDSEYIEKIPRNHWSMAVRNLSKSTYNVIIELSKGVASGVNVTLIQNPQIVDKNYIDRTRIKRPSPIRHYYPTSERSKTIGDRGEEIVFEFLKTNRENRTIRWVANEGETPGYDIELIDKNDELFGIEVKSTTSKLMENFQITINEYNTITNLKDKYIIAIVTEVETSIPKISFVRDIHRRILSGEMNISPVVYRVDFS